MEYPSAKVYASGGTRGTIWSLDAAIFAFSPFAENFFDLFVYHLCLLTIYDDVPHSSMIGKLCNNAPYQAPCCPGQHLHQCVPPIQLVDSFVQAHVSNLPQPMCDHLNGWEHNMATWQQ